MQEVNLCPFSFPRDREYKLWMLASSGLDTLIGGLGNDSAKRVRIRGVTKAPNIFDLFLGKLACLLNVDIGGEKFNTRRIRGIAGGGKMR